ncbi:hypothetical protein N7470_001578 [Penicillium chermesinum]|nr:hypothetical protein N7470_001578 [Penicillium chermesinum]
MNYAPDPTRTRPLFASAIPGSTSVSSGPDPPPRWSGMPSEDDQRLHNVGVAALAAVSQYPHAVNEESHSYLMSEVVNAVRDVPTHFYRSQPQVHRSYGDNFPTQQEQHYPTRDEADSMPSEAEMTSGSRDSDSDVEMDSVVQDLIEQTASWHQIATIANPLDHENSQKDMVTDYDPVFEDDYTSPSSGPDDDLEDLIRFYPGEEEYLRQRSAHGLPRSPRVISTLMSSTVAWNTACRILIWGSLTFPTTWYHKGIISQASRCNLRPSTLTLSCIQPQNLTIDEFIQRWMDESTSTLARSQPRALSHFRPLSKMIDWEPPKSIYRPRRYKGRSYDIQQIPWSDLLKVKRSDARALRDAWYTSYHNLDYSQVKHAERLPDGETFYRAKSMHTAHTASVEHFQLRNLMSVQACDTVSFSSRSRVYSWTPAFDNIRTLIDVSRPDPDVGFLNPVKISSMRSAYGLTIAGGFCGEYVLQGLDGEGSGAKGLVAPDYNDGITNHVDIIKSRSGGSVTGVFASNDRHLRLLDCETNILFSDQELSRPINCTATSPDSRLRVVIGDSPEAWIIEADTGRPVHPLRGHRDYGFACAWSPDMRHIATSNQDKTVIIWDSRTWRALETIDSDVAGYRSLRYSPVGGGPRTLLCCEPADRISIIDAQLYQSRQVHDFFGEIGGADYSPDGGSIWVANTDPHFGGFMRYERQQWGSSFGLTDLPNEWLREADLDLDDRCTMSAKERRQRFLRNLSDDEHDQFLL